MNDKVLFKSCYLSSTAFLFLAFLFIITLLFVGDLNLYFIICFLFVLYCWLVVFFRKVTFFLDHVVVSFPLISKKVKVNYNDCFVVVYNHKGARNPPHVYFYNKKIKSRRIIFFNSLLYSFEIYNKVRLIEFIVSMLKIGVKFELQISENNFKEITSEIKAIYPEIAINENVLSQKMQ